MLRRIAVLTGDDDAPGMNAAIRAVTRAAHHYDWGVFGICNGYEGLLQGELIPLTTHSVDGVVQRGGSMLESIDNSRFVTEAGQELALRTLNEQKIDAMIVIGGEETQTIAHALSKSKFAVNGVAASVENDLAGFDMIVGVDTALNLALDAIDHLKITKSTDFCAILEVAGRRCGYLALVSAIASDADGVVIPEIETTPEEIEEIIRQERDHGHAHPVIVVAEGAVCNADRLMRHFAHNNPLNRREQPIRLGHIQRRAAPNAFDRFLGAYLGVCAVDALARGEQGVIAGYLGGAARVLPYAEMIDKKKEIAPNLMQLASVFLPSYSRVSLSHS
ncbi:MAG TPA: ATP-dependent 6-phosphofructokinase [Phototrophicaceae bacterium]|nr:ATP-dependent 6-phosphofructokinase [Phototrophicaceae bacterium]